VQQTFDYADDPVDGEFRWDR